ncbi:hypothetical protein NBRC116188_27390 [Oceaniserpentilla sp. 4NH20-0058]|uniref:hypothetical protein n=1 Tax=Oceaniserpentilla sp. 4NH20-0058 TaxID=3127660 RepID=UPI00310C41D6
MKILWVLLLSATAQANEIVFPNYSVVAEDKPYLSQDVNNTNIIYTEENKQHAEHTAGFEMLLQPIYEDTFGYQMDTQLSVGLISSYNQIANGFSTQFPSNRQVNYMGGAQLPDYFSSSSWLDMLLLHETAHNYQVNAKENVVSSSMFKVFRNGGIFFPFFPATTPNLFESSFMLEGNAVLNESWHGRGGRLYSGRYRAMNYVHAKAGNLTKERMYNQTKNFPYGEGHYIFGSQYQYYLAETYGLDTTNKYFKNRSKNWYFPFTVNEPTKETFGVNFNTTFSAWAEKMEYEARSVKLAEGHILGRSKYYSDMNTKDSEVLFLTMERGVSSPKLFQYNKQNKTIKYETASLALGRVFPLEDGFYTVSARHTSPWRITQGLFDEDGMIKPGSEGKIIQGYLSDGQEVYFDTTKSYVSPQLFVGDEFYAAVNSSVIVKDDHLYYFIQNGKKRTLFRDKQALYTLDGFYSIVADVDSSGAVYFIANSKMGSSLYKVNNGNVSRVLNADNVVAAKLAGDNQVIVEAISADDYYYALIDLNISDEDPYVVKLMWDDIEHPLHDRLSNFDKVESIALDEPMEYGFFNNFSYTMGSFIAGEDENGDSSANLFVTYSDPLGYNELTLKAQKDGYQSLLLGTRYSNNEHFILYGVDAFYVADNGLEDVAAFVDTRDYGIALDVKLPFLKQGYWAGQLQVGYYQDYIDLDREPVSLNVSVSRQQSFGHSFYTNEIAHSNFFVTHDRGDNITGSTFGFSTDLPLEFYAGFNGKYAASDSNANRAEYQGVKLESNVSFIGNDPSSFHIPSLLGDVFAKQVTYGEVNLSKVFNGSAYYFKFPLSLQREAVSIAYRRYQIEGVDGVAGVNDVEINQASLALSFDASIVNKAVVRYVLEMVHNDSKEITDSNFLFGRLEIPF